MKTRLLKYFLAIFVLFILAYTSVSAQVLVAVNNTTGLTSGNIYYGQNGIAVQGVTLTPTGSVTLASITFSCNQTIANYFGSATSFSLYRNSGTNYSTGTNTLVGGTFSYPSGTTIKFVPTSETITSAKTYYLVANYSVFGTVATTAQFTLTNVTSNALPLTLSGSGNSLTLPAPTVTFSSNNTTGNTNNGITSGSLSYGQTPITMFGFTVTVTNNQAILNSVTLSASTTIANYFPQATFQLYRCSSTNYATGTNTLISGASFAVSGTTLTVSGIGDTYSPTTTGVAMNYFIVASYSANGSVPSTEQFTYNNNNANYNTSTSATSTTTTGNFSGNNFTLAAPTVTISGNNVTGNTNNGITTGSLSYGQTGIALYGFSITVTNAPTTLTGVVLTASQTITNYFGSGTFKIYRCSTTNYSTGTNTLISTASLLPSGTTLTITGLSDAYAATSSTSTTMNYFIVADYTVQGSVPANEQFTCNSNGNGTTYTTGSSSTATVTAGGTITGNNFSLPAPTITVTGLNTASNGITPNSIAYGNTGIVMYGFSLTDANGPTTISEVDLSTGSDPIAQFFSNFKVYSSPTSTFNLGTATLLTTTLSPATGNSAFNITGFNQSLSLNQTQYYFVTADWTSTQGNVLPTTMQFTYSGLVSSVTNTTTSTSSTAGQVFNLGVPVVTVSNYTTGVYTGTTIVAGSTYNLLGLNLSYSAPTNMHELTLDLNYPLGGDTFTSGYISSLDIVDATTGVRPSYITGVNNNGGNIKIEFNINAPQSLSTNLLLKVTFNTSFAVHKPTAFTVCFNTSSNVASNVCGNNSNCTVTNNYNVASTGNTCSNTFMGQVTYDWTAGANTTDWNTSGNWSPTPSNGNCPGANDIARIGYNALTNNKYPIISSGVASSSVAGIIFGTENSYASTLTVNTPFTVSGNVTVDSAVPTNGAGASYTVGLSGSSTLTVTGNLNIGDGTTAPTGNNNSFAFNSAITGLTIGGSINLNSYGGSSSNRNFAATLNITGGTVTTPSVATTFTNYQSGCINTLSVGNAAILKLTGATSLSGLSATGTNTLSFNNNGATVQYAGTTGQTVYTSSPITGLAGGVSYYNLIMSTTGTATVGTATAGTLTVANDMTTSATTTNFSTYAPTVTATDNWVNSGNVTQGAANITINNILQNNSNTITGPTSSGSLTVANGMQFNGGNLTCGAGAVTDNGYFQNNGGALTCGSGNLTIKGTYTNNAGTFTAGTGMVYFDGASQTLTDNTTAGTLFNNVTFNGGGTTSMTAGVGNFGVSTTGVLTMASNTKLVAGTTTTGGGTGYLTLMSGSTGSAAVTTIPAGCSITGNVNVQRYITGGSLSTNRGYRMLSAPVNITSPTSATSNYISLNTLDKSVSFGGVAYNGVFTGGPGSTATSGFEYQLSNSNSTIYLYDERKNASDASFTSGKSIGVTAIGSTSVSVLGEYGTSGTVSGINIPVGNGYLLYFVGPNTRSDGSSGTLPTDAVITNTGFINQQGVTVNLWYTPANGTSLAGTAGNLSYYSTGTTPGYNMVGNPYPCTLNLNTVVTDNGGSSTLLNIYLLQRNSSPSQAYVAYTPSGTSAPNIGYALSGEGFIVKVAAGGKTLKFLETEKSPSTVLTGNNSDLSIRLPTPKQSINSLSGPLRTSVNAIQTPSSSPLTGFYMKLEKDSTTYNYCGIYYSKDWSDKLEPLDAIDLSPKTGLEVYLSSLTSDGSSVSVNHMSDYTKGVRTKLFLNAAADGLYKLKIEDIRNVDTALYSIFLIDNYKKDSLDIGHYGTYAFNILNADTNSFGGGRFVIAVEQKPVPPYELASFTGQKVTTGVQLNWKTYNEGNYTGFVLQKETAAGQYIQLDSLQSNGSSLYSYVDTHPVTGNNIYRLLQDGINGNITYSAPITINYSILAAGSVFTVYPNPAKEMVTFSLNSSSATTPNYTANIYNTAGELMGRRAVNSSSWTEDVTSYKPGTYIIQVKASTGDTIGQSKFVKTN